MSRALRILLVLTAGVGLALTFRACLFTPFRIPTSSMAGTLLPNDYVMVWRWSYGWRPLSAGSGLRVGPHLSPHRGDVAVFLPPRGAQLSDTPYIKRIVGLPGDEMALRDGVLVVNGQAVAFPEAALLRWSARIAPGWFEARRWADLATVEVGPQGRVRFVATVAMADSVRTWPDVHEVALAVVRAGELGPATLWGETVTRDHWPAFRIPAPGDSLPLNDQTPPALVHLVRHYERLPIQRLPDGTFTVSGTPMPFAPITQRYYVVLGDQRMEAEDSRHFGLVPHSHLVGRAWWIYFSWDEERHRPRWNRITRWVARE